jgi:hypothetical protein
MLHYVSLDLSGNSSMTSDRLGKTDKPGCFGAPAEMRFTQGLVNTCQEVLCYCFHSELPASTLERVLLIRNTE